MTQANTITWSNTIKWANPITWANTIKRVDTITWINTITQVNTMKWGLFMTDGRMDGRTDNCILG